MTDERIDIEIQDKVSPNVRKKVLAIADAARRADSAVSKLKAQLADIDSSSLAKIANASAKVTNALAREKNATARLNNVNARMSDASSRTALLQQRLATETERTTAAQSRAAVAASRARTAALQLKQAQDRLAKSTQKSNRNLAGFVRNAAAFAGIGFSVVAIVNGADAFTVLENKLRNVVETERQLVDVTGEVFDIARRTRAPVQDTAKAFQRFDFALKQLGASQRESLQLTETVNQALILSGATTNEASSALLQLSQAFNKGKLDGDEFRSVMEIMPKIADAIAKQLKVTRGELLNLAPEGKITAEVMRRAFASARQEISDRFAKTIPTLGQAFTNLKTSAVEFFGEINKSLGITEAMSRAILFLANNFKLVGVALAALAALLAVMFGPDILLGIVAATTAVKEFTIAIAANPIGLLIVGLTTAIALFTSFKDDIKVSEDGIVSLGDTASAVFELIGEAVGSAYNSIVKALDLFPKVLKDIVVGAVNAVISVVEKMINGVLSALGELLKLANDATKFLGLNPVFNTDFDVDLSRYKGNLTGAAREFGNIVEDEFKREFNTDFIGDAVDAISERSREIAKRRIGGERRARSELRGVTVPNVATSDQKAIKQAEKRADALAKINRELNSEIQLLGMLGPQLQIQQRFDQINNELFGKKITLNEEEKRGLIDKLKLLNRESEIQVQLEQHYNSNVGQLQQIGFAIEAANRAYDRGIISAEQYANRLAKLNVEAANLKIQIGDGTFDDVATASLGTIIKSYKGMLSGITNSFGNFFNFLADGFADSIGLAVVYSKNLGDALRNVARSALAELISSLVKVGIQYLVNASIGQSIGAATAATNAALAATAAAAWAPAAALASLATLGANAGPAAAAVSGTMALSQGLAISSLAGFEEGGFTGNIDSKKIAGVVHGQEFVVNAAATARNRKTLEAINSGAQSVKLNNFTNNLPDKAVKMNVYVENYGSSNIEVERLSKTDVRIIARDEARQVVRKEAPDAVAADVANPNSKVSKSLNHYTNTQRSR